MRLLYDDGISFGKVLSLEEIEEKRLKEAPPNVQKILLKIREINKANKKFWSKEKKNGGNEMNNSEIAQHSIDRAKEFGRKKDGQISLAVDSIIADLTDRRGLRQEWENIDEDVKNDIIEVWECIMRDIFHL